MSRVRRPATLGALLVGLALLVLSFVLLASWLQEPRRFAAAIPQPSPLFSTPVVGVSPGDTACVTDFTLTPRSEVASWQIGTKFQPGVPMSWSIRGDGGFHAKGRIAGGYADNSILRAQIDPPDRPIRARMCWHNLGRREVVFYAAEDRTVTTARTLLNGKPDGRHIQLRFDEAQVASVGRRWSEIATETTRFSASFIQPWMIWLLAALVAGGVPLLVVVAMTRASVEDDRSERGS